MIETLEKDSNKTSQEEREKIKVENLREKLREQKLVNREQERDFCLRKARHLDDETKFSNFVSNDITDLAKSLKVKSLVTSELLHAVMNVLLDSQENISALLKVDGALQSLLRLLSGQNEKFQLIAAECICNLALGSKKQSFLVLKAAESYLMVHLSGRNPYVKEVCAVALGNLSSQGKGNIELLMKQGFLPKLINLLGGDSSVEAAAIYALTQLVYHGFDILRPEDLENCLLSTIPVFKKKSSSVVFLTSLLSSCKNIHCHFVSNEIHFEALNYLMTALKGKEKEAVYFLRIVSNLSTEESIAKSLVEKQSNSIRDCIQCLLQSQKDYLQKECLSWVGNFLNSSMDDLKFFGMELVKENFEVIAFYVRKCNSSFSKEMFLSAEME